MLTEDSIQSLYGNTEDVLQMGKPKPRVNTAVQKNESFICGHRSTLCCKEIKVTSNSISTLKLEVIHGAVIHKYLIYKLITITLLLVFRCHIWKRTHLLEWIALKINWSQLHYLVLGTLKAVQAFLTNLSEMESSLFPSSCVHTKDLNVAIVALFKAAFCN